MHQGDIKTRFFRIRKADSLCINKLAAENLLKQHINV